MYKTKSLASKVMYEDIEEIYNTLNNKEFFINENLEKIVSENPLIYEQIDFFKKKYENSVDSVFIGTAIYDILTKQDLILVESETVKNLVYEISNTKKESNYLNNIMKRINTDNENVAKLITDISKKSDFPIQTKLSGVIIYRILELQTQINDLYGFDKINQDPNKFPKTYKLREELNYKIITEDYESAAKLRDRINSTQEKL